MTGLDLKIERIRAGFRSKEMAAALGVSPSRLTRIEAVPRVTDAMLARYMAALSTCRTSGRAA